MLPNKVTIPLIFCVFFMLNMMVPLLPNTNSYQGMITHCILMVLILWLMIYAGRQYYINAYRALLNKKATMSTLVSISTISTFTYSTIILLFFQNSPLESHLYYESIAFIIGFVNLGGYLEALANKKTYKNIHQLMALKPKVARKITQKGEEIVPVSTLAIGDKFQLLKGDKIPFDAKVCTGIASIDESMISGESSFCKKETGDEVFAGTIVKTGSLICSIHKDSQSSLLQQIINEIDKAQAIKPPIANLVNKITQFFVPIVLLSSLLTALVWYHFGPEPRVSYAFITAMTVLVIACPCALGLAIPTSIRVAIGLAAKNGLLIRKGRILQIAGTVDTVIFDKTGTLTSGKPTLVHIERFCDKNLDELLALALSLELQSPHPVAMAIKDAASIKSITPKIVSNFHSLDSKGITGVIGGETFYLGNKNLLEENFVDIGAHGKKIAQEQKKGHTVLLLGNKHHLLALFIIADPIRPEAKRVISTLKAMGIKVKMLTGDGEHTASEVAKVVGITDFKASLLPQEKLNEIKLLLSKNQVVAMVGDGINDAPSLSLAQVGIAISRGSDIANESSDVSLMTSNLETIITLLKLSKKTLTNIKQNLIAAFLYNTLSIPVAAGILYPHFNLLLNPGIASACMALSSLCVVLNANRLQGVIKNKS